MRATLQAAWALIVRKVHDSPAWCTAYMVVTGLSVAVVMREIPGVYSEPWISLAFIPIVLPWVLPFRRSLGRFRVIVSGEKSVAFTAGFLVAAVLVVSVILALPHVAGFSQRVAHTHWISTLYIYGAIALAVQIPFRLPGMVIQPPWRRRDPEAK